MKNWLIALVLCMHSLYCYADLQNQDIDIFMTNPNAVSSSVAPNVLILLDNTANWNTAFTAETQALNAIFSKLNSGINVGLMMFSETGKDKATGVQNNAPDGAYTRFAIQNMTGSNVEKLQLIINNLNVLDDKGNGGKLSQMMHEAYRYFSGKAAYSGVKAKTDINAFLPSTTTYKNPIADVCQKNYIIYISNGPVSDNVSDNDSSGTYLKAANNNVTPGVISLRPDKYQYDWADEWSRYMSGADLNSSVEGVQNVTTFTIDIPSNTTGNYADMQALLKSMANVSNGLYIKSSSNNYNDIKIAIETALNHIISINSVFTSTAVTNSVNNYGGTLDQVYVGMFRTDANALPRWHGNLKQYKLGLSGDRYVYQDKGGATAVSANGEVVDSATSIWSTESTFWDAVSYPNQQKPGGISDIPDGSLTIKGGHAEHLRKDYAVTDSRVIYTCSNCSTGLTQFKTSNAILTALPYSSFGLSQSSDIPKMINWVRGRNVNSDDPKDGLNSGVRGFLHGDVVHSSPLAINYNRTSDERDVAVFYGGNDGLLHAVKGGNSDDDGGELWSFLPKEFYPGLGRLYYNSVPLSSINKKPYFFDGPIGSYLLDADGDYRYDNTGKAPNALMDKVYIYATARRGGRLIYALDVTNPSLPAYLWSHTDTDAGFKEMGQTWSIPKVVKIAGRSNPVLIFGGGYDAAAEDDGATRSMARAIFVLDAYTGDLVWKAVSTNTDSSDCAPSTCTKVSGMDFSIPGGIATVDRNLDGDVERLYAADTGGNVWRVDIALNKNVNPNVLLFSVNRIALLGGNGTNARKFMYEPDVVFGDTEDRVQLGSGDREKPFSLAVQDMFFSIKDSGLTTNVITSPYTLSSLYDATADLIQLGNTSEKSIAADSLASARGWYIKLNGKLTSDDLGCHFLSGERVSGRSITLKGVLYFSTFLPNYSYKYTNTATCSATVSYNSGSCVPSLGLARVYILNFANGAPYSDTIDKLAGEWSLADRYVEAGTGFLGDPSGATLLGDDGNLLTVPLFGMISDPGGLAGGLSEKVRSKVYWYELTD